MTFRKSIFWLHLGAGITVGIIVAIMSATGITIAFEQEIEQWLDRDVRTVSVSSQATPLTIEALNQKVAEQRNDLRITSRVIPREANQAYEYRAGRDATLYVNPYTGAIATPNSTATHNVLHTLEEWHRWLGMEGKGRDTGKLITGIANLAFLFMCITGVYMWWPRSWKPKALRPAIWFVGNIKGRARDFNWHNVFGCWSAIVLIVIVASGVVMSFAWANRLVFTLAGEEAPQRGPGAGPRVQVPAPESGQDKLPLDAVFAQLAKDFPKWETISFDSAPPPKDTNQIQPINVTVMEPDTFQSRGRIQLSIDPYRGNVLSKLGFEDRTPGARARLWLRFLHTGEAFGLTGKVIATIAALASLFLVYTGFALSYRRFFVRKPKAA